MSTLFYIGAALGVSGIVSAAIESVRLERLYVLNIQWGRNPWSGCGDSLLSFWGAVVVMLLGALIAGVVS